MNGSIQEKEPDLLKYKGMLKSMVRAKQSNLKELIAHSNNHVIRVISEIALNVIKGIIPLTKNEIENLRKWKPYIKKLISISLGVNKKREMLLKNTKLVKIILKPLLDVI